MHSRAISAFCAVTVACTPLSGFAQTAPAVQQQTDPFTRALISTYNTNPSIKSQRFAVQTQDEGVNQALSNFRPTATYIYTNGRQRSSFDGSPYNSGESEVNRLDLSQPLFRGGRTLSSFSEARNLVRAERENLRAVEQSVMLEAITAYMDVLQAQSIIQLSRNNEIVLGDQLRAAQQRFDVGEVTRTDVAQAKARLSRAISDTAAAVGALENARATFERVVGYAPDSVLTVPQATPILPTRLEDAIAIGEVNNANLRSAHYQYEASDDDVYEQIGGILPEVTLRGSLNRSEGAGVLGDNESKQDQILLNVSVPLYQSGAEYSRIRASKKRTKQRQYDRDDLRNVVREGVRQAWEGWQTSLATIAAQQEQIEASELALRGVKQEQRFGERTVLDVLDAEQELFVARVGLVQAQRDRVVALYNVLAIIGKLTARDLQLPVRYYDPEENYDDVKFQFIGY